MLRIAQSLIVASALMLAGCMTSPQVSAKKPKLVASIRSVVGTELLGTKGATAADQDNIDGTVAGLCGVGAYTKSECAGHGR